ncbi:hypothetical protein DL98DRAFT_509447 [Cadophora sp. DSE1049]|nr:hypothetical protein DL98DRAFT_509447 [Cadophora sp. DSE1049]
MPLDELPPDRARWTTYYKDLSTSEKTLQGLESGSKLSWPHAICLRVLHNPLPVKMLLKSTQDKDQSATARGTEEPYFLRLVASRSKSTAKEYTADGHFGVFFSLLDDITDLPQTTQEDTDIYFTPVAKRTRSGIRQAQDGSPSRSQLASRLRNQLSSLNISLEGSPEKEEQEQGRTNNRGASDKPVTPDRTKRYQAPTPSTGGSIYVPDSEKNVIAEDESIVNMCILALLIPLFWPDNLTRNFSAVKKSFTFNAKNKIQFTACVDGLILSPTESSSGSRTIIRFIEAKRAKGGSAVRIQEAAEAGRLSQSLRTPQDL